MDYQRIYDDLITYRKKNVITNGYFEKHHIVMRSLGGSDEESNLVRLTAREHYIAHLLLARFQRCSQTAYAVWMMQCKADTNSGRSCIKNSRMYEWIRKEFIKYVSRNSKITSKGDRNSQHGTQWICNITLQENRKISKTDELPQGWILGRNKWVVKQKVQKPRYVFTEEHLLNLSRSKKGKAKSDEWKKKISDIQLGKLRGSYNKS